MSCDPIDLLKSDHRAIHSLLSTLSRQPDIDVVRRVVRELSMHDALEKAFLNPMMAIAVLPDKGAIDEALDHHERISELLADIDRRHEDDPCLPELLNTLRGRFAAHVALVEGEVLPALPITVQPTDLAGHGHAEKEENGV